MAPNTPNLLYLVGSQFPNGYGYEEIMAPENTLLQKGENLSKICNEKFLGFKLAPREKL